ncbi:MAG: DUF1064 domain-containing protein [Planctomycetes bacterium]|nr:DUF1064 domain-containing protein [Planctomycetota bacterium]
MPNARSFLGSEGGGKPRKYQNKRVQYPDGRAYDSVAEARYALQLEFDQQRGWIVGFLEQVSIRVSPKVRFVADFVVWMNTLEGLSVRWIDVKGKETPTFKVKRDVIQSRYPFVKIELVKPDWVYKNCPQLPFDAQVN